MDNKNTDTGNLSHVDPLLNWYERPLKREIKHSKGPLSYFKSGKNIFLTII